MVETDSARNEEGKINTCTPENIIIYIIELYIDVCQKHSITVTDRYNKEHGTLDVAYQPGVEHSAGAIPGVFQKYRDGRQFSRAGMGNHSAARKQPYTSLRAHFCFLGYSWGSLEAGKDSKTKRWRLNIQ